MNKRSLAAPLTRRAAGYDLLKPAGTPIANAWAGTAPAWKSLADESTGNARGDLRRVARRQRVSTGHPATSPQTHRRRPALPRARRASSCVADPAGVLAGHHQQPRQSQADADVAPHAALQRRRLVDRSACRSSALLAQPRRTSLSATDQSGNTGGTLPRTTVACRTASLAIAGTSRSQRYGQQTTMGLPARWQTADTGVQIVATVTMSAANTGTFALCLARPLPDRSDHDTGVAGERVIQNPAS